MQVIIDAPAIRFELCMQFGFLAFQFRKPCYKCSLQQKRNRAFDVLFRFHSRFLLSLGLIPRPLGRSLSLIPRCKQRGNLFHLIPVIHPLWLLPIFCYQNAIKGLLSTLTWLLSNMTYYCSACNPRTALLSHYCWRSFSSSISSAKNYKTGLNCYNP